MSVQQPVVRSCRVPSGRWLIDSAAFVQAASSLGRPLVDQSRFRRPLAQTSNRVGRKIRTSLIVTTIEHINSTKNIEIKSDIIDIADLKLIRAENFRHAGNQRFFRGQNLSGSLTYLCSGRNGERSIVSLDVAVHSLFLTNTICIPWVAGII